ncbi:MAG: hypothetical protein IJU72_04885 [Bacteroidales bacterium]|nr:hypothetical protein [Bacteroidales bacterium]
MKFTNEATIYSIHAVKLIATVLLLLVLTLLLTTRLGDLVQRTTGLPWPWAMALLALLYLLMLLYFRLRHADYISYNDEGSKIVIKSYPANHKQKKVLYEIPKQSVYKLGLEKVGLREELTIYTRSGTKVSKYPPLSLSATTKAQRDGLIAALNQIAELPLKTDLQSH